jgi:hypothetical protein
MVTSGLVASAVMLAAGAAFSGGITISSAQLVSFDRATNELTALPSGAKLTTYLNQTFTSYVAADLRQFEPPDPCFPPVQAWNFMVKFDATYHVQSNFIFQLLLGQMSALGCNANLTSISSGAPQPLVGIQPTN